MARITGYAQADVAPEWLFEAPIHGVRRLIERVGGTLDDFDLIEINEAFAAQVLADGNELGFDWDRVNVNGGAIALGHPIGASGARVLTTLLYELRRRGGGQGPRHALPRRWGSGGHGGRDRLTPIPRCPSRSSTIRQARRRSTTCSIRTGPILERLSRDR